MKNYLLLLGSNWDLSQAEIKNFSREILSEESAGLTLVENLKICNPRNLPKSTEQIFLDRLGGVVRMAEVVGEFFSQEKIISAIKKDFVANFEDRKVWSVAISGWGVGKEFQRKICSATKKSLEGCGKKVRLENVNFKNMTSGQIFNRKLLKKGAEFIIWKRKDSFLLCKTMANQNLRNYELRDRAKPFRDSKMGMMPPKLAQIMINLLGDFSQENYIIDPFCGSGTINAEAAIMGFKTIGSDFDEKILKGAQNNFDFLSEKFRYEKDSGEFLFSPAEDFPWDKFSGAVVTEGWLGENFEKRPDLAKIEDNAQKILDLWTKILRKIHAGGKIDKVAFCLPCWNFRGKKISIAKKLFVKVAKNFYTPKALFGNQQTFVYERTGAFVGREICILQKK